MTKEKIIKAFSGKILGVRNYKSNKKKFFADDFISDKELDNFLDEVDSGESDITPAGKSFLENYFGFENLAKNLLNRNEFFLSSKSSPERLKEVRSWLEDLEPMEIISFIEKARGNIAGEETLKEELLPPEEFK